LWFCGLADSAHGFLCESGTHSRHRRHMTRSYPHNQRKPVSTQHPLTYHFGPASRSKSYRCYIRTYEEFVISKQKYEVFQHIHHDSAPLFMLQVLMSHNTCSSELPSKEAEFRFIFVGIVTRSWIMHAWKGVSIVFSCEVCHLLSTICLNNGSFNFVFVST
jgi:hypothetical protein